MWYPGGRERRMTVPKMMNTADGGDTGRLRPGKRFG
mgnify:CR=1 FL=1